MNVATQHSSTSVTKTLTGRVAIVTAHALAEPGADVVIDGWRLDRRMSRRGLRCHELRARRHKINSK